jgi:hypothetical protein
MTAELGKRDKRIIPPEELQPGQPINYRLYDVFQAGVLFFWILEDGRWPFESTWDYVTGNGSLPFSPPSDDRHERLNRLITEMLSLDAGKRPDPLPRVLNALQAFE